MQKKYSLVIFDFDGTLCDNYEDNINSVQAAYKQYGYEPIPAREAISELLGQGVVNTKLFELLNPNIDVSIRKELINIYQSRTLQPEYKNVLLFPGVIELLQQLKKAEIPCVIVSNRSNEDLNLAVEIANLNASKDKKDELIFKSIGIEPGSFSKPDVGLYQQHLEPLFNIDPSEILVVGDTITDLLFAQNIGADACWVRYGHGKAEECEALSPQYSINDLKELSNILVIEEPILYKPLALN
jgi:phosphoglycolate phosphatase